MAMYDWIGKARCIGSKPLPAIILRMEQHVPLLYSGYERYADRKLEERSQDTLHMPADK